MNSSVILADSGSCDAGDVIRKHGYNDITPDISLYTAKRFEKDREVFRFVGWHKRNHGNGKPWIDVEMSRLTAERTVE